MSVQAPPATPVQPSARAQTREALGAWLLVGSGVLLGLATVMVELLPLLRGNPHFTFDLGLYQVIGLAIAWVLTARGLSLTAAGEAVLQEPVVAARGLLADVGLTRAEALQLALVTAQLGLLIYLFRAFALENPAFHNTLAPLILVGFVLHDLSAAAHRPAFLLALSFAALYLILGAVDGFWLVAVGAGLVGICHLPIAMRARISLLVIVAATLAVLRTGAGTVPWSAAVWPILGSFFMFRTIVYVYDLKHDKVGPGFAHRLGYFFMLPNITFPLFPVVDYGAYRRGYYSEERYRTYQRGLEWMLRGTMQLLLYRVVYQMLTLAPAQVATWDQLLHHVVTTFLLYIRVSGQFHLIIGILHLFGFHLPETHKGYYLASSFTELWRRINIYWKDFMMKVVYYPTFFRLRRHGNTLATVLATLLVFVATWSLHSYQWFWLLGQFPVTWPDTIFWGILAGALVFNSLREARKGRERSVGLPRLTLGAALGRGARIAATFLTMCVLWSLWMSPSVGAWLAMFSGAAGFSSDPLTLATPLLILLGMVIYGTSGHLLHRWRAGSMLRSRIWTTGLALLLVAAAVAPLDSLPDRGRRVAGVIRTSELNATDVTMLTRGYYEDLMGVSRFNSQLWEVYMRRPAANAWPAIWTTPAAREIGGFMKHELVPSQSIVYLGEQFTTNAWGIRDREYPRLPEPGTTRIALVGSSIEMGWGVADEHVFEGVAERLLNGELAAAGAPPVEIMNFSVAAYKLPQHVLYLQQVLQSQPHVLMLAAHDVDAMMAVNHVMEMAGAGIEIPHAAVRLFVEAAGLGSERLDVVRLRLEARQDELESLIYGEIVRAAEARGALPVWLFVPMADRTMPDRYAAMEARAQAAGFTTLSIAPAYDGIDLPAIRVKEFDYHPNPRGHELLGVELAKLLRTRPDITGLGRSDTQRGNDR